MFAEGHFPIRVEGAARVDADRQRSHLRVFTPTNSEEIADRAFHRGVISAIPIDAQDSETPATSGRHPELLDRAGPVNIGDGEGLAGFDAHGWRDFPAFAQVAPGMGTGAFCRHAAFALGTIKVFRADGARFSRGQARQIAQVQS